MTSPLRPAAVSRRWGLASSRCGALLASLVLLGLLPGPADAEPTLLADADAKAGLVFQFARFAEWPTAAAAGDDMHICLLGTQGSLQQALLGLAGKPIRGKPVAVRTLSRRDDAAGCRVLVMGESKEPIPEGLKQVRPAHALTISDEAGFIAAGGMIGLVMAGDKVRFEINLDAMSAAGISLPAQVVRLARNYAGRSE